MLTDTLSFDQLRNGEFFSCMVNGQNGGTICMTGYKRNKNTAWILYVGIDHKTGKCLLTVNKPKKFDVRKTTKQ